MRRELNLNSDWRRSSIWGQISCASSIKHYVSGGLQKVKTSKASPCPEFEHGE